ncbi:MAG TPA: CocE/NonD family hydrolase [Nevskia sp.]|nr:CocE/NonD family hydrolase [Nevskia sp.]
MLRHSRLFPLFLSILLLQACGSSSAPLGSGNGGGGAGTPVAADRDGKIYAQSITSPIGDTVVFQVFEPTHLKAGQTYPLVLNSHGYGGTRATAPNAMIQKLMDNGYYVISIDERGNGQSSGTVRVMDPDYEGQDLVAVLDWAERLEGLRRHGDGSMVVGSYGGSYGGMYQFLLMGADPKHRLHVLAPDITPHDLVYSLDENNVVKSGWGLALVAGGEAGVFEADPATALTGLLTRTASGQSPLRQDPTIVESLTDAALYNAFTPTAQNFFKYHSVSYFCDGLPPGPQAWTLPVSVPDSFKVAPTPFPQADVLLSQGIQDSLFNFNNGYANYQCLKARGGDVRLISHQGGHILPVSLASVPLPPGSNLQDALDPFYAALNPPEFQGPSGAEACGGITVADADFAWFQEKLQGIAGAIDKVLTTGSDFCISLADKDAIQVHAVKHGGTSYTIASTTPQLNSLLGVVGSLLGGDIRQALLAVQPLYTAPADDSLVAGIPTLSVTMANPLGASPSSCNNPLNVGGCDPIFFFGIGYLASGSSDWKLVDAQLTPLRGFGDHAVDMNGIGIRLKKGDQLGLLIYAYHTQYPITWSRDIAVPAATISGTVQLPVLDAADVVRQGV